MTRLIVSSELRSQLLTAGDYTEICDAQGHLLGYFMPKSVSDDIYRPPTDEELAEAEREPGGRPLADILRDLERRS
jgi:hypothetical protein